MHILCLDCPGLAGAFRELGHQATALSLAPGKNDLAAVLHGLDARPDCIIHHELLGERRILNNLETAPCPTLFVAVDTHLNLFWHRSYGRLFDAVATPHLTWFESLPVEWRHPQVFRFSHTGQERPWAPHRLRQHDLALCARMTQHRQLRQWMADMLRASHGLHLQDNLSFAAMLDLYADSRLIPNESICFEVNFRLLEGASCGAVVLSPETGPDQDCLFVPGKEMLVYRDGLELREQIAWLKRRPEQAESIGRAAWERVRREHLIRHRAQALLERIPGLERQRATGDAAAVLSWLTRVELTRNGVLRLPIPTLLAEGEKLPPAPEARAVRIRLLAESGRRSELETFCRSILAADTSLSSIDLDAAASGAFLRLGDFRTARQFWNRHLLRGGSGSVAPDSPFALCLAWADALRRAGRAVRIGSPFIPEEKHLPFCAFEFLVLARFLDGKNPEASRRLDALTAPIPAYTAFRLGVLAELTLADQNNWRLQFAYGALSLKACRVDEGLFELAEARAKAESAGKSAAHERMLAALPSHAYITPQTRPGTHA